MSKTDTPVPRRRLLTSSAAVALTLVAGSACKKAEPASCSSTAGLSPKDIELRSTLDYEDRSADPAKTCDECVQYVEAPEASRCGGCKIMKGPIHPKGTCNVFAPKA